MNNADSPSPFELVTITLPDHGRTQAILDTIRACGCQTVLHISARGVTLTEDNSLLSRMFPQPSPKHDIYQLLVPKSKVETLLEEVTAAGSLHVSGAGAVFSTPCDETVFDGQFNPWRDYQSENSAGTSETPEEKRVAIYCIVERSAAEPIAKAAILSGAPGPSVYFAEGRGLRDRLRLLRIAKTAEKEIVGVVVEEIDEELVFNEMSKAGRITEPGRGFIYSVPVSHGLINLRGTESSTKHSASLQEVIRAIDELKGDKSWRGHNPLARVAQTKESAGKPLLRNLVRLSCMVARDHTDAVMESFLLAGAPAASVSHGRIENLKSSEEDEASTSGTHLLNQEWSLIQTIVSPALVEPLKAAFAETAQKQGFESSALFTSKIPKAQTYTTSK